MPILYKTELLNQGIFIWQITESEHELLELLPNTSVPEYKHEGRRISWLATRCLINEMFSSNPTVYYSDYGKPKLADNNYHISVSHSGDLVSIARSTINCGIDIQEQTPKLHRITSKFINAYEAEWIKNKINSDNYHHLIWCAKEAIFKVFETNVHFKRDITIAPFSCNKSGVIQAKVTRENKSYTFQLAYQLLGNYFLVFTHE